MTHREAILNAAYEAERLHKKFNTEARAEKGEGRIDVFGMLANRDIPVMFRPLKGLLGAFIDDPDKGVIVTTQRPLPVQRFTAAHELGHATLGHQTSLDEEELLARALFISNSDYDIRELEANAFASTLLTPSWLIAHHMTQQEWNRDDLKDPRVVYQLALRMGSSYSATCYALEQAKGIDRRTCESLIKIKPREIKQSLVSPYKPQNWYGDVWVLTERDHGMILEGSRSDLVMLNVKEHSSSGYLWQFHDLVETGLTIRTDSRSVNESGDHIGGVVFRTLVAEANDGATGHVNLKEVRPWQKDAAPLNRIDLDVNLSGPVRAGLLPQQQEALLGVA